METMTSATLGRFLGTLDGIRYMTGNDENCFIEKMPSKPAECVAVFTRGGGNRERGTNEEIAEFFIQVRGERDDAIYGRRLTRQISNALFALRPPLVLAEGTDDEADIRIVQVGIPRNLGQYPDGSYKWGIDVEVRYSC